jgi:hypothetical protein
MQAPYFVTNWIKSLALASLCCFLHIKVNAEENFHNFVPAEDFISSFTQLKPYTGEVAFIALSLTGTHYKYGGNSPETGMDCSGFVRYVFKESFGRILPRSAEEISHVGASVEDHELQPGDLVFFNTLKRAFSHVGIYLGENKFIHAPSAGGKVRVESMDLQYWKKRFNGARRLIGLEPKEKE